MTVALDSSASETPSELARLRRSWNVEDVPGSAADPAMQPVLTGLYTFAIVDGEVASVESVRRITEIEDIDDRRALARLLPLCDGRRTLRALATAADIPEARLALIAGTLYELGVVADTAEVAVSGVAFNRHLSSVASPRFYALSQRAGLHQRLMTQPSRRLLLGWLVESQHFIASAAEYMSVAVATAPSDRTRMLLSDYMSGEFWHGAWVRDGLVAAGLGAETLERAAPLPGTLAVTNALRALATRDFYAFAAALCLHESSALEGAEEAAANFWTAIQASGALPNAATDPFRIHHLIDCAEAHGSISEQLFLEKKLVTGDEQRRIRRAVLAHAHTLAAWFEQTLAFYQDPEGPEVFSVEDV